MKVNWLKLIGKMCIRDRVLLERENGKKVTLEAFRNKDISGGTSSYEVVHQVVPDSSRVDRGDVSLLINGLPIIHIELKKESAKDGFMQRCV